MCAGDCFHTWWHCGKIQKILASGFCSYSTNNEVQVALLGDWKERPVSPPDVILINNTMVAARSLIASRWKSDYVPQDGEWLSKVWYILFGDLEAMNRFYNVWGKSVLFRSSTEGNKNAVLQVLSIL